MKENINDALNISNGTINIKATTTEGIGIIGREEGIACQASVLLTINKRNAKGEQE
jgi:2-C-methyl-D-erythritol 2,4-cyclodiphosphate synthase